MVVKTWRKGGGEDSQESVIRKGKVKMYAILRDLFSIKSDGVRIVMCTLGHLSLLGIWCLLMGREA